MQVLTRVLCTKRCILLHLGGGSRGEGELHYCFSSSCFQGLSMGKRLEEAVKYLKWMILEAPLQKVDFSRKNSAR